MSETRGSILLVEDDDGVREVIAFNLEDAGFTVTSAEAGEAGVAVFEPERHDVVITDIRMPDIDGMAVMKRVRAIDPETVVVVMTAYGGTDRAVDAMRQGAFHYVEKPINTGALVAIVDRAVELRRMRRAQRANATPRPPGSQPHELVAASQRMSAVLRTVDKVANTDATVLIHGESGTGKELVARSIHERSPRASAAFVTLSCAAIPGELLESTLFGHERGAFTGAVKSSPGKFVLADGGTLFLDEVAELPLELQGKLLRALQEGEVDPVGAARPVTVDVRIVAATHRDLAEEVREGRFREDLYWRLAVVPLELPALRERREDVPVLLRFFLRKHGADAEISVDRALDEALVEHTWPGNVRELENLVKRMVTLREGERLGLDDLPPTLGAGLRDVPTHAGGLPFELPEGELDLRGLERDVIAAALEKHGGNQSATARYLKVPRHVLTYRIEKYGIDTG